MLGWVHAEDFVDAYLENSLQGRGCEESQLTHIYWEKKS